MSLYSWLAEVFRPCVHIDRTLATMFDDPNEPKVTTVAVQCEICGRVDKTVIKAEGVCQHKWLTMAKNAVFVNEGDSRPTYHRVEQKCERCGAWQAVDLLPPYSKEMRRKRDEEANEARRSKVHTGQGPQPSPGGPDGVGSLV